MSKKQEFIKLVEHALGCMEVHPVPDEIMSEQAYNDALAYFEVLKNDTKGDKPQFTDNGKLVLKYMQDEHTNYQNMFKSREIAEGIFISSRSVSGSIRKLVTDGYVEKMGRDPVIYSLTDLGKEVNLDESN